MTKSSPLSTAKDALKHYFGYDDFRPMQGDVIESILSGRDTVVLMPTGGGKSICFQLPALVMRGMALVVSPLISLMKDQVEALRQNGVKAAYLNSSQTGLEQRQVEDDIANGTLKLLYVSPERLLSGDTIRVLQRAKVNLIAIDEAHCISAWGHDFRPEYTKLSLVRDSLGDMPMVALTATADKTTRRDIVAQLDLQDPNLFVSSFDRPNLNLEVRPGRERIKQIVDWAKRRPNQSGIVYCLSRKSTEMLSEKLKAKGINAEPYHAGLHERVRSSVQERFVRDELPVVCATIAFGMGIDKSNVRWVIHYNLPKNLEGFYQEIGRAGRDGGAAETLLFYSWNDRKILADIIADNNPKTAKLQIDKLDRMYQYATTVHCRRRLLLTYFGDDYRENCGHCDICRNPPKPFDGTRLAQIALSGVARTDQRIGQSTLVAILRGTQNPEIAVMGYADIKTFGAGREVSLRDWHYYIEQLIHQGLLEVAPDKRNAFHLTASAQEVLFGKRSVELVKREVKEELKAAAAKPALTRHKLTGQSQELFQRLRKLRLSIARETGKPPYIIFNDTSLEEMSILQPTDSGSMKLISGVGDHKLKQYGDPFLKEIRDFIYEGEE
ncbi:MAG: DNA helicase RecQ [Saprospiraceae bacterium]